MVQPETFTIESSVINLKLAKMDYNPTDMIIMPELRIPSLGTIKESCLGSRSRSRQPGACSPPSTAFSSLTKSRS
jgi:hypothetical protein